MFWVEDGQALLLPYFFNSITVSPRSTDSRKCWPSSCAHSLMTGVSALSFAALNVGVITLRMPFHSWFSTTDSACMKYSLTGSERCQCRIFALASYSRTPCD